ncbi:hypothetical protein EG103P2_00025 [Enterococcus phage EG103P2]|nr:hypothetical protein EG103P2_00025 [Enterococcus phage EG103P2]
MQIKKVYDLEDFQPWSGAVDTWEKILEADKVAEVEIMLEDTYAGDEIEETTLNDILWFDSDYVLDYLGLLPSDDESEEN